MSKFDFQVHHREAKTGKVIRTNPYRMHITKQGTVIERDGKKFYPNGEEIVEEKKVEAPKPSALERLSKLPSAELKKAEGELNGSVKNKLSDRKSND